MKITNNQKAGILAQALPNIQKYRNKIVVVKYGGNAMINEELKSAVMSDLVLLNTIGIKIVLVHGGGPEISKMLNQLQIESKFVDGLRVTDKESADVVQMVLAGKINKNLTCQIGNSGGKAIGLSGLDGKMLECKKLDDKHGFVGEIINCNAEIIIDTIKSGFIPVISSIGFDKDSNTYNINADTVASEIASKIGAEALISMTDTIGLIKNINDESTLINEVFVSDCPKLIADGIISGGMIPKIDSMINAIRQGVKKAFIIDGRVKHSILIELLTDEGMGTMFRGR